MLFIRRKKFKPYVCPALRNRPWHKKVREKLSITWRNLKPKLAQWGNLLFMDIPATSIWSISTYEVLHEVLDDSTDMFESSISIFSDDLFAHDDDDISRGMWDATSIFYPICHSDDDWSSSDDSSCFSTSDSFDI
jgi:hypothetical protein